MKQLKLFLFLAIMLAGIFSCSDDEDDNGSTGIMMDTVGVASNSITIQWASLYTQDFFIKVYESEDEDEVVLADMLEHEDAPLTISNLNSETKYTIVMSEILYDKLDKDGEYEDFNEDLEASADMDDMLDLMDDYEAYLKQAGKKNITTSSDGSGGGDGAGDFEFAPQPDDDYAGMQLGMVSGSESEVSKNPTWVFKADGYADYYENGEMVTGTEDTPNGKPWKYEDGKLIIADFEGRPIPTIELTEQGDGTFTSQKFDSDPEAVWEKDAGATDPSEVGGEYTKDNLAGKWYKDYIGNAIWYQFNSDGTYEDYSGNLSGNWELDGTTITMSGDLPYTWEIIEENDGEVVLERGGENLYSEDAGVNNGDDGSDDDGSDDDSGGDDDDNTGDSEYDQAVSLPGEIQMEDFISGGEGVAYHDETPDNEGGEYRTDEAVDIGSHNGGYNVGWTKPGEWLKYNIDVPSAGTYHAVVHYAQNLPEDCEISIEVDGSTIVNNLVLTNTGGWGNYSEATSESFTLDAGEQTLKLEIEVSEAVLDYIEIVEGEAPENNDDGSDFSLFPSIWEYESSFLGTNRIEINSESDITYYTGYGDSYQTETSWTCDFDESNMTGTFYDGGDDIGEFTISSDGNTLTWEDDDYEKQE